MRAALIGVVIALASLAEAANAFEIDGFRSGMTRAEVETKVRSSGRVSEAEPDTLIVSDHLGGSRSFNFCADKLVSMQNNLKPSLRQFALVMRDFNAKYGQPFSSSAASRVHAQGQIEELGIWWRSGSEFVSVYYMGTPMGESLSISYQLPNSCFNVPR